MINTINDRTLKSHMADARANLVIVDQFSISEYFRNNPKMPQYVLLVFCYLKFELIARYHTRQRMIIGFSQEVDATRFCKPPEAVQYFRCAFFQLFNSDT